MCSPAKFSNDFFVNLLEMINIYQVEKPSSPAGEMDLVVGAQLRAIVNVTAWREQGVADRFELR